MERSLWPLLLKITTIEKQTQCVAAWSSVALGVSNWLWRATEVLCIFMYTIYNLSVRAELAFEQSRGTSGTFAVDRVRAITMMRTATFAPSSSAGMR